MNSPLDRVLGSISEQEVVELTKRLVEYPSLSGQEQGVGEYLAKYLDERGFAVDLQQVLPGRPNVVAVARGDPLRSSILFNGHLDIAPPYPGWSRDPFRAEVVNGMLYGAGVFNMKGAIAAFTVAADAIHRCGAGDRGDVIVTAVSAECDTIGLGTKFMLDTGTRASAAICGEPSSLSVHIAHGGIYQFEVVVLGRPAHISRRQDGRDTIRAMARLVLELDDSILSHPGHQLLYDLPRLNIGTIHGGLRPTTVPPECRIRCDVRLIPGMSPETIRRDVEKAVEKAGLTTGGFKCAIRSLAYEPPFEVSRTAQITRAAVEAHRYVLGAEPEVGALYPMRFFGTDGTHLAACGIPTVIYGPGSLTSGPDECISVPELLAAAKVYAAAAFIITTGQWPSPGAS